MIKKIILIIFLYYMIIGSRRKPRGPTLLRDIWGRNPDEEGIKVNFNKRGQPVGPNKKKFTGFLGTLARNGRYSPLDIDDWRKVPKENKDAMIKLVKVIILVYLL